MLSALRSFFLLGGGGERAGEEGPVRLAAVYHCSPEDNRTQQSATGGRMHAAVRVEYLLPQLGRISWKLQHRLSTMAHLNTLLMPLFNSQSCTGKIWKSTSSPKVPKPPISTSSSPILPSPHNKQNDYPTRPCLSLRNPISTDTPVSPRVARWPGASPAPRPRPLQQVARARHRTTSRTMSRHYGRTWRRPRTRNGRTRMCGRATVVVTTAIGKGWS